MFCLLHNNKDSCGYFSYSVKLEKKTKESHALSITWTQRFTLETFIKYKHIQTDVCLYEDQNIVLIEWVQVMDSVQDSFQRVKSFWSY